ncbi:HIT-like protein [Amylostereum chailletii]|nr:HIT-like protein [Amylostereum chailletii]
MASSTKTLASCIFCKIIKGDIPSFKLVETDLSFSFLDIGPLAKGHALVIPKYHAEKLHQLPDEYLSDAMPVAKKIATALGVENYNILQNNGRIAHQEVDHVHFHIIPKPEASDKQGLVVGWPTQSISKEELAQLHEELKGKLRTQSALEQCTIRVGLDKVLQ